jgi:hypothetical protein
MVVADEEVEGSSGAAVRGQSGDSMEGSASALFFPQLSTFLAQPGIYLEDLFWARATGGAGSRAGAVEGLTQIMSSASAVLEWAVLDWNRDAIGFCRPW